MWKNYGRLHIRSVWINEESVFTKWCIMYLTDAVLRTSSHHALFICNGLMAEVLICFFFHPVPTHFLESLEKWSLAAAWGTTVPLHLDICWGFLQHAGVPLVILMTRCTVPLKQLILSLCLLFPPAFNFTGLIYPVLSLCFSPAPVSLACFLSTANLLVLFIKLAQIAPCIFTSSREPAYWHLCILATRLQYKSVLMIWQPLWDKADESQSWSLLTGLELLL